MSLIPCTQNCRFQTDGLCTLSQAQAQPKAQAVPNDFCLNFTPRSNQNGDGLTNVVDPDQL